MEYSKVIILLGAVVLVSAFPQGEPQIRILKNEQFHGLNGNYSYSYETADGISKTESGYLKDLGGDETAQTVVGEYTYTHPDGTVVMVQYDADEEGFRPKIKFSLRKASKK